MVFKTLDLEADPFQQGFQLANYHLILAESVLHITSNLTATLEKLHKLLKSQGHLVFLEIVILDSACANVGFGSLEG